MKLSRIILFSIMLAAVAANCALADLFFSDPGTLKRTWRYTDSGVMILESSDGRSNSDMVLTPDEDMLFVCKQGTDKMMRNYDPVTFVTYDDRFMAGTHCVGAAWGHDYDGDGDIDMFIASRTEVRVVDVNIPEGYDGTTYTVLATWGPITDDPCTTQTESIGQHVVVGPDMNGDGIGDIFMAVGGNNALGAMMVLDANSPDGAPNILGSYAMPSFRAGRADFFGPDRNGDGVDDLWVTSQYNDKVFAVDANGTFIGDVTGGSFSPDNPNHMTQGPDGLIYIGTRFDNPSIGATVTGGDVVEYDPDTNTASIFAEVAGANLSGAMVYTTDRICVPPEYDITGDCAVDAEDLAVLVSQWLDCTDPNTANCP